MLVRFRESVMAALALSSYAKYLCNLAGSHSGAASRILAGCPNSGQPTTQSIMLTYSEALAKLDDAILESGDVYINKGVDAKLYLARLESDLRAHLCEPFEVSAKVMQPGFPFWAVGEKLHAYCIAHHAGYWLVYQPTENRFLCFWGEDIAHLGAHGVFGSPLPCWSA